MRIKIWIEGFKEYGNLKNIEFFINDFPTRPFKGDLINITSFCKKENFSENEYNQLEIMTYTVDFVSWEKDDNGVFLRVYLEQG